MLPRFWKKTEPKRRRREIVIEEEDTNREGHWYRSFSARAESWPLIESWAVECGFRLTALKGHRRLYRKGDEDTLYSTFVDIRHHDGKVVVSAWVEVSPRLRYLSLFLMPRELRLDTLAGWKGIRVRRDSARYLNRFLARFHQPAVLGSENFHIIDMDLTTLSLSVLLLIPLHVFLAIALMKFKVAEGLSNGLLVNVGQKLQLLFMISLGFIALHHFAIAKRVEKTWVRLSSILFFTVGFTLLSIFVGTKTKGEILQARVTHFCVLKYDEKKCGAELSLLTPPEREALSKQMSVFQKHIGLISK